MLVFQDMSSSRVLAQKLEVRDPLHTVPVDVYRLRVRSVSPEVHYFIFCFSGVEDEIIVAAPCQFFHLIPDVVNCGVICKLLYQVAWVGGGAVLCRDCAVGDSAHTPVESRYSG